MLTRGGLSKSVGGGGVQYDILEILNFVGVYSSNLWDKHSKLFSLKTIAVSNIKYSERLKRVWNSRLLYYFLKM
jgi:hypothetical protein